MNSTLTYGPVMTPALTNVALTNVALPGATTGALLRAGAPAAAHRSALDASCLSAPVMSGVRPVAEIAGGYGTGVALGGAELGNPRLTAPKNHAQQRASVRWSDDL